MLGLYKNYREKSHYVNFGSHSVLYKLSRIYFKYRIHIHDEVKSRVHSEDACYHLYYNFVFPSFFKKIISTCKTTNLPIFICVKHCPSSKEKTHTGGA
jgi:hypothetical protein